MSIREIAAAALVALVAGFAMPAYAQSQADANTIVDEYGKPIVDEYGNKLVRDPAMLNPTPAGAKPGKEAPQK